MYYFILAIFQYFIKIKIFLHFLNGARGRQIALDWTKNILKVPERQFYQVQRQKTGL